ncbi:Bcr/CflA family efflux MFS transporter [Nakamurella antarctica]|uniref:Bcr/CflA family efflux MFS transporter n=1 Tax=Nakamurella antarctica TaxID=1902245 RepID=A0A3G8ZPN0_9ACTN|nr:multidrug effflux MFS transporter [Nakamurella antarctica]AZI59189.1 Bcr/CflA family efflux MFS transporter [Nakamurella antarctica]
MPPYTAVDQATHAPTPILHQRPPRNSRLGVTLVGTIALMSAVGPLATDMYLPAFPTMAAELGTDASSVQLTLTTFMIGLALGQLVLGSLSDRIGRRPLLISGAALLVVSSALCAVAPSIGFLMTMRFIQGIASAAGMVLGRAVVADKAEGVRAARIFSILGVIGAISPIVAPILGAVLFASVGWRGVFWAIMVVAILLLAAIISWAAESLPTEHRHRGGVREFGTTARRVLSNREYLGHTITLCFAFGAIFAYVAASPFVLQNVLGFSSTGFSIVFAVNSCGLMAASATSAAIVGRVAPASILRFGVVALVTSTVALALLTTTGLSNSYTVLPLLFVSVASIALIFSNGMVLAIGAIPYASGTASAILGSSQFALGAAVSPLVGLAGENSALPMGLTMAGCGVIACFAHFVIARPAARVTEKEFVSV